MKCAMLMAMESMLARERRGWVCACQTLGCGVSGGKGAPSPPTEENEKLGLLEVRVTGWWARGDLGAPGVSGYGKGKRLVATKGDPGYCCKWARAGCDRPRSGVETGEYHRLGDWYCCGEAERQRRGQSHSH